VGEAAGAGVGVTALKVGLVDFEDGEVFFKGVELACFFRSDGALDD